MGLTLVPRPAVREDLSSASAASSPTGRTHSLQAGARAVEITAGGARLKGTLAWPCHPSGFVLFTRAVGGKQRVLQDLRLAERLQLEGFGTLLIDRIKGSRGSGSELKVGQLWALTEWLVRQPEAAGLPVGSLGLGVGAAGALVAAGASARIGAVVACGGDPEKLGERLFAVRPPTLLIAADEDYERLRFAHPDLVRHGGSAWLTTIPGPGPLQDGRALEEAGCRAAQWFARHLIMEPIWRASHPRGR